MHSFDAQSELDTIRKRKALAKQSRPTRSLLSRHRAELVKLRQAGASYPELATWLRRERRITVAHTTVMRYLSSLPELRSDNSESD